MKVFLGGTTRHNDWRSAIVIPGLLERGIAPEQIFNPLVAHWDAAAQADEDARKADPEYLLLFVLASPEPAEADCTQISGYSLAEMIMALYDAPQRTAVLVDVTGLAAWTAKGLKKAEQDLRLRFPSAPIFTDYAALLDYLASRLVRDPDAAQ
jgi:hypothetical protein